MRKRQTKALACVFVLAGVCGCSTFFREAVQNSPHGTIRIEQPVIVDPRVTDCRLTLLRVDGRVVNSPRSAYRLAPGEHKMVWEISTTRRHRLTDTLVGGVLDVAGKLAGRDKDEDDEWTDWDRVEKETRLLIHDGEIWVFDGETLTRTSGEPSVQSDAESGE